MLKPYFNFSCLILLILLTNCNTQPGKQDFMDVYHIDKYTPVDTTAKTLEKVKQAANWKITFEEYGNFILSGTEKYVVGYWDVEMTNDKVKKLLLQGGGWTIFGRFDGNTMYFDYPYKMFDSLFSHVTFTREDK